MEWYKYEDLLEKAYSELPKEIFEDKRFEIPQVKAIIEGNRTIITNFTQICNILNRDCNHVLKFFARELATAGHMNNQRAVFIGKFSPRKLQEKLNKYCKEFVICNECGKPDTKLIKEDRITFLKCMACGAKYPVRTIK